MEAVSPVNAHNKTAPSVPNSFPHKEGELALVENLKKKFFVRALKALMADLQREQPELLIPNSQTLRLWVEHYLFIDGKQLLANTNLDYQRDMVRFLKRIKYFSSNASSDDPSFFPPTRYFSASATHSIMTQGLAHFAAIRR